MDAVELSSRVIAQVAAMGGPPGDLFRDSVGGQIGSGLLLTWDFDDYTAWAAWEDASANDEEFQALFAEVLGTDSPFVLPFERRAYTSLP
jgi:hypothetical protein